MRIYFLILALVLSASIQASGVTFDGVVEVAISPTEGSEPLIFELPRVKLSSQIAHALKAQLREYQLHGTTYAIQPNDLPRRVDVGMRGTPVLNQGRHGSCVTFAVTGAIDALLGAGDYISQLCNLELNSQLAVEEKTPYSGWNGNYGTLVLQQIERFGIITQNHQKLEGCAGVKEYPLLDSKDQGKLMSETEFLQHSVDISRIFSWEVLMFNEGWLLPATDMNALILKVKRELAQNNLLTFGVLLDTKLGHGGALGQYHVNFDTWMLTPQIIKDGMDGPFTAGHDLVITGYDDDAVVVDEQGNTNKGIFFLRNSWSERVGDQGNYYVSYDYFKFLAQEVHLYRLKK